MFPDFWGLKSEGVSSATQLSFWFSRAGKRSTPSKAFAGTDIAKAVVEPGRGGTRS